LKINLKEKIMKWVFLSTQTEKFLERCPTSGKIVGFKFDSTISRILFPVVGILAIIWFLVRVIPKPTRAAYPSHQVAAGMGIGFLGYLFIILSTMIRKILI
jgi:hypothetical protein